MHGSATDIVHAGGAALGRRPWAAFFSREFWRVAGPAALVSVGYMDPGNWGTDIEGGARFGYQLLWVILVSNVVAIFLQSLAAKLGLATGRTLAENCRAHMSRPVALGLWAAAEVAVMATDLAEILGGAIAFHLLFGLPLWAGAALTGIVVMATLGLYRYGVRAVEFAIGAFVSLIGLAYLYEISLVAPDWAEIGRSFVRPTLTPESVVVAVGILGATVMPHNLFLHSGLILSRRAADPERNRTTYRFAVADSVMALNVAWLVNSAILVMSAAAFHANGLSVASIGEAHRTLVPLLGGAAGLAFAVALLCSGLASSATGTLAGQMILEGFLEVRIPLWLRRVITMVPALAVIAWGLDPLHALVLSQVVLSLQLPFTVVPLVLLTNRGDVMGALRNGRGTRMAAAAVVVALVGLNAVMLVWTLR
ncbi:MAG TPA: Nramp family divalent metal transporter [Thermodesulfobacteriota bacterium]